MMARFLGAVGISSRINLSRHLIQANEAAAQREFLLPCVLRSQVAQHRHLSQGPVVPNNPQQAEMIHKMLDMLATNPQLQEMMMSTLPKFMRRPEVIQQMLANPEARNQIANMMMKQGLSIPPQMLASLQRELQAGTMQQLKSQGMDPSAMFSRFAAYPGLLARMSKPHVMQAISDISANPSNIEKYRDQPDIMEVYSKIQEIMAESVPQPTSPSALPSSPSTNISIAASSSSTAEQQNIPDPAALAASGNVPEMEKYVQSQLGLSPQALMSGLMQKPELAQKIQSPRVQQALAEISASPWKIAKYVLDKEVMGALKDLRQLLKDSKGAS